MGFSTSTCTEFVEVLASKAPVPGGGGASALVGAVGTALGNMVGSLTVGKKKYAEVEEEMAGDGRVLVRASGTEPLLRVMTEAPTEETVTEYCERIADVVREEFGIE